MTHCPDHFETVRDIEALKGRDDVTSEKLDEIIREQAEIKTLIIKQNSRIKSLERWRIMILGACSGVIISNTPGLMKALALLLKGL